MTEEKIKAFPLQTMIPFSEIYAITGEWKQTPGEEFSGEEVMVIIAAQIGIPEALQGDASGMMFGLHTEDWIPLPVFIEVDELLNVYVKSSRDDQFKLVTPQELISGYCVLALNELEL